MPRSNSILLSELGPGGLSSFALALAGGLLGLGVPVIRRVRSVLAESAGDAPAAADAILVLGRELVSDLPTAVFTARLDHGRELLDSRWASRLIVSGGMTGTASRSEAAAGRDYLLARGVAADSLWTEERSRFTLENLFCVRETLRAHGMRRLILVTDPLHLARAAAMARGLGLEVLASPAPMAPPRRGSAGWWLRALREGFLLHWYHVGLAYGRVLRSEKLLSRVT